MHKPKLFSVATTERLIAANAMWLIILTSPLRFVAWTLGTILGSAYAGWINGWRDAQ